jgi:hypothetical protein
MKYINSGLIFGFILPPQNITNREKFFLSFEICFIEFLLSLI